MSRHSPGGTPRNREKQIRGNEGLSGFLISKRAADDERREMRGVFAPRRENKCASASGGNEMASDFGEEVFGTIEAIISCRVNRQEHCHGRA